MANFRVLYLLPIHLFAWTLVGYSIYPAWAESSQAGTQLHRLENIFEPGQQLSPEATGDLVRSALIQNRGTSIRSASGYLVLSDPVKVDTTRVRTTATYGLLNESTAAPLEHSSALPPGSLNAPTATADGKTEVPVVLEGEVEAVANAAAFLSAAMARQMSTDQVQAGASIAMAGVNYTLVDHLMDGITGIVTFDPLDRQQNYEIDMNRLKNAIQLYNQILVESSDATVLILSQNQSFLEIAEMLKQIRSYIP